MINFEKLQAAINNKTFDGDMRGVPIVKYEAVVEGEVPVGLGPLHTQYDGKGFAYTSMFIDSNITKWKMPPWTDDEKKDLNKVVLDKVPTPFQHRPSGRRRQRHRRILTANGCVAMNKLSAGRHINVGPIPTGVESAHRHQRRQNEDGRGGLHGTGAAFRPDPEGERN